MHFAVLLVFTLAVTAISGADTNVTKPEVETVSVNPDEPKLKMLPSTQRLVKLGCMCIGAFSPVCATDGDTYGNDCYLACENHFNPYLFGLCYGECPCCKEPHKDMLGECRALLNPTSSDNPNLSPAQRLLWGPGQNTISNE